MGHARLSQVPFDRAYRAPRNRLMDELRPGREATWTCYALC